MRSQQEIFQEIADLVIGSINDDWLEIIINYQVDSTRSKEINTYIKNENSSMKEKSVPFIPELNRCLRELRDHLAAGNKQEFTGCKLHIKSNGEFNASYSYEPVDWNLAGGWNFDIKNA